METERLTKRYGAALRRLHECLILGLLLSTEGERENALLIAVIDYIITSEQKAKAAHRVFDPLSSVYPSA